MAYKLHRKTTAFHQGPATKKYTARNFDGANKHKLTLIEAGTMESLMFTVTVFSSPLDAPCQN